MSQFLHPDLAATPAQPSGPLQQAPQGATFRIPLDGTTLVNLIDSQRFHEVDRHEAYLNAVQDFAKRYDWDGQLIQDGAAPIKPGWVVPLAMRKPRVRWDLPRVINNRFTGLLFGSDRFPEITVPGDKDAEEFVKGLAEAARLPMRMIEARRLGGAGGAVGASFGFVNGKPRIEVHSVKHLTVLEWRDRESLRPAAVLKVYCYPREVFDPNSGKVVQVDFYYARQWTELDETVWQPIPYDVAKTKDWARSPHTTYPHNLGFCPFYWAQNMPDSDDEVGVSDFDGLHDNFDEINRLLSAQARAVSYNADPTFVVKIDPAYNEGQVQKGQGAAVYSPGGAEYAVLPAHSVSVIKETLEQVRQATLDTANVVLPDPDKLSGAAQSAQALRILYAPMLAQADVLREQYGEGLIKPLLLGMLRAARQLGQQVLQQGVDENGVPVEVRGGVQVPPRIEQAEDGAVMLLDRLPGESEHLVLNWNPYFSPTWPDIKAATEAAQLANGGKPLISQRTSLAAVQSLFGVESVDDELARMEDEADAAIERAQKAMAAGAPAPGALDGKQTPFGAEDDAEEPEDDGDEAEAPVGGAGSEE